MRKKSTLVRHLLATTAVAALIYASEPAAAQTFNWTGPYIGVNLGYIDNAFSSRPTSVFPAAAGTNNTDSKGFMGGVTGGYNYQFPGTQFVLGAEGDIDFASGKKTNGGGGCCGCGFGKTKISAMGTFRARFGYAVDRALFFATAGLAVADITNQLAIFGDTPLFGSGDSLKKSGWRAGWVAGGGMEYAITEHCVLKIEALYADFGKTSVRNSGCSATFKNNTFITRVGAAWKF